MIQTFIKPLDVERNVFLDQIETKLGAKLKILGNDTVTNGTFNTYESERYLYVVVNLYDEDEPANYVEGVYNNIPYHQGHKSSFVKSEGDLKKKLDYMTSRLIKLETKV